MKTIDDKQYSVKLSRKRWEDVGVALIDYIDKWSEDAALDPKDLVAANLVSGAQTALDAIDKQVRSQD